MAVAQHPRVAGERPVRAGGGGHVAGADWWTGPAGWRVGVAPVSRAAIRLCLLLKELAKARPPSPNCAMSSIQCSGLLFVCFTRTTPVFKDFFLQGVFSTNFVVFSQKGFSTLILVVFPLCLGPPVFFS